ncbi:hypothetical protein Poli38472_008830 [Pythium oligandrum]|uniref:Sulfite exporter TauE/SafE family protein n=1 Tax=Pythium oligandrum TaxID=41045 RepID=A0A8K1C476_PYTOL|nr:hypothetical protein Poli38472_008830 [Pythium oligandrum]|eukprot:TMW56182.1 hypothetical protein Poli38472_008830 [Pythium oligandrum]
MRLLLVALLVLCHATLSRASDAVSLDEVAPYVKTIGVECANRNDCGFLPGLACIEGVCDHCRLDADCSSQGDVIRRCRLVEVLDASTNTMITPFSRNARGEEVKASYCIEKDLFDPFTWDDVLASVLAFMSTALGSGCGVGGGGLLVPAFILVIGLSPKHAIPLSKATIFGNAIAIYLFNLRRKHPVKPNVPIINYAVASIMEPTTLIGSIFGVMMNHVLPNWLILFLLISLLSYVTKKTYDKGTKIRRKEIAREQGILKSVLKGRKGGGGRGRSWSIFRHFDWKIAAKRWLEVTRQNRKLRAVRAEDEEDFKTLPPLEPEMPQSAVTLLEKNETTKDTKEKPARSDFDGDDSRMSTIRQSLERKDADIFPLRVIIPLFTAWLVVLLQALLRGGHGAGSIIGVKCNSVEYWFLTLLPVFVLTILTWRIGYHLRLENRLRVLSDYKFLESDIHWTWERVTKFPVYCVSAGVAAGLLGIGGGMVKGPIMLDMGVLPPVQSATASYMILYTSSSTTLQFAVAGQYPGTKQYDYVMWFAFVGFLGGFCGQKVVAYLVKKYKRESIMVYILAGTIGLSAVCMGYIGLQNTLLDIRNGASLGLSSLCGGE